MDGESAYTRRRVLRVGAGATAAVAATSTAGTAAAQTSFDGWLSDTSNFDGTVADGTGRDEVTVRVGAQGNGGAFAFAPPAVKVDPGTRVKYEWTGKGAQHNVVEKGGDYESDLYNSAGVHFERTFDTEGVSKYFCSPHKPLGMKGVVVVGTDLEATGSLPTPETGQAATPGGAGSGGGGGEGGGGTPAPQNAANQTALRTLGAMLVLGFLSPVVFAVLLRRRQKRRGDRRHGR